MIFGYFEASFEKRSSLIWLKMTIHDQKNLGYNILQNGEVVFCLSLEKLILLKSLRFSNFDIFGQFSL